MKDRILTAAALLALAGPAHGAQGGLGARMLPPEPPKASPGALVEAGKLLAVPPAPPAAPAEEADPLALLERHQQALFERVAPAVVFLARPDGFGSGFFVDPSGLILTNAHVVGNAETIDVVLHDGRKLRGKVIEQADDDLDLALVQVDLPGAPALPLACTGLRVGAWAGAVGHGRGGIWTFTTGMVSNIYPGKDLDAVFQTQIPINAGNSGGPVIDRAGRVLGVVTAKLNDAEGINFAIRSEVALRSLARIRAVADVLTVVAPAGVPVLLDGTLAGKGPRFVVPVAAGPHRLQAVIAGAMRDVRFTWPEERRVVLE